MNNSFFITFSLYLSFYFLILFLETVQKSSKAKASIAYSSIVNIFWKNG